MNTDDKDALKKIAFRWRQAAFKAQLDDRNDIVLMATSNQLLDCAEDLEKTFELYDTAF